MVTSSYPYTTVNVGASTALYGMIGLLIGYFILNWRGLNFLPITMRIKLVMMLLLIIALAIVFTLGQENISYMGHLGGFLAGIWLSALPPTIISETREKIIRGVFITLLVIQLAVCFIVFYLGKPRLKEIASMI
jgi:membrane associated rhomboid family serine protease